MYGGLECSDRRCCIVGGRVKSGKVHCSWENEDGIESDQRLTWQRGHISSLRIGRQRNQKSKFSFAVCLFVV